MKKVLRFDETDNVAVALEALQPGDELSAGSGCLELQAQEAIPQGHKVALRQIPQGGQICKYGHVIGVATEAIPAGGYVHVHNVLDPIGSWKKRRRTVYDPAAVQEIPESFRLETEPELYVSKLRVEPDEAFPYDRIRGGREYPWRVGKHQVYFYQYKDRVIWGMTARLMLSFVDIYRQETAKQKQ